MTGNSSRPAVHPLLRDPGPLLVVAGLGARGCVGLRAMLLPLLACAAGCDTSPGTTADTTAPEREPAASGTFVVRNSAGRSGSWYLPEGWNVDPVRVLVAYHGTGGQGADALAMLLPQTEAQRFGIVAPDSRQSPGGEWTWEVGTEPGEVTEDLEHTRACIDELVGAGLLLAEGELGATGFSGGGSSAPYLATNDARFAAYAVLHGGAFPGGFGDNMPAGWFSTGEDDTARTPEHVRERAAAVEAAGYPAPEVRIYPGGHAVSETEAAESIAWWLGGG